MTGAKYRLVGDQGDWYNLCLDISRAFWQHLPCMYDIPVIRALQEWRRVALHLAAII